MLPNCSRWASDASSTVRDTLTPATRTVSAVGAKNASLAVPPMTVSARMLTYVSAMVLTVGQCSLCSQSSFATEANQATRKLTPYPPVIEASWRSGRFSCCVLAMELSAVPMGVTATTNSAATIASGNTRERASLFVRWLWRRLSRVNGSTKTMPSGMLTAAIGPTTCMPSWKSK